MVGKGRMGDCQINSPSSKESWDVHDWKPDMNWAFWGSRRWVQAGAMLTVSCPQCTCAHVCYVWGLFSPALGFAGLSTSGTFIAFSSGCQFLSDKLEPIQRRVTRTKKGLKIMSSQGVLKEPGLFSLGERRLSGGFESCFQITSCERRNRPGLCISKVEEKTYW